MNGQAATEKGRNGRTFKAREVFRFAGPSFHVTRFVYAFALSRADIAEVERRCGCEFSRITITGPDGEPVTVWPNCDGAALELKPLAESANIL